VTGRRANYDLSVREDGKERVQRGDCLLRCVSAHIIGRRDQRECMGEAQHVRGRRRCFEPSAATVDRTQSECTHDGHPHAAQNRAHVKVLDPSRLDSTPQEFLHGPIVGVWAGLEAVTRVAPELRKVGIVGVGWVAAFTPHCKPSRRKFRKVKPARASGKSVDPVV